MSVTSDPPENPDDHDSTEEAVSKLSQSLKSCHKVVSDFRAALVHEAGPESKPPDDDSH